MKNSVNKVAARLASELIGSVEFDAVAETVSEIHTKTNRPITEVRKLVRSGVANGTLESVWKKVGRSKVAAYRPKK
jgi:hypothetical protein